MSGIFVATGISLVYQKSQWHLQRVENIGITVDLPNSSVLQKLSEEDELNNILLRVIRKKNDPFLVTIRKEKGLRPIIALTRQDMLPMLLRNLERAYPQRFPGYKKVSEKKLEYGDKKAAEVSFTYTNSAGGTVQQRLLIVEYDGDTALYFSAQAQEENFDRLNKKYFNRIFSSVRFK